MIEGDETPRFRKRLTDLVEQPKLSIEIAPGAKNEHVSTASLESTNTCWSELHLSQQAAHLLGNRLDQAGHLAVSFKDDQSAIAHHSSSAGEPLDSPPRPRTVIR